MADQFDNVIRGMAAQRAMTALSGSRPAPDAAGKANVIARETGLPADTVDRNLAELDQQVQSARAARIFRDNPTVAQWAGNSRNAAVGADDMDQLAKNAAYWHRVGEMSGTLKAVDRPAPTFWNGILGVAKTFVEGVGEAGAQIRGVLGDWLPDLNIPSAPGTPTLGSYGAINDRRTRERAAARIDAVTPEYKSTLGRGLYSGASSIAQMAPTVALGLLTGSTAVGVAGAGLQSGVPAYNKYRDRGGTRGEALAGGAIEGGAEALGEVLPMGFLVNQLGKKGAGHFLKGFIGRELPTELATTLVQNASDTAIANPDKTWGEYLREQPDALVQTAIGTLMTAGLFGGVNAIAGRYVNQSAERSRAADAAGALDQAMAGAAESKTRSRDPEAFRQLVGLQTQDTSIEHVFVPAESATRYFQAHEIDPADDPFWSKYENQIREAQAAGGDIVIPTADAAAYLAGTPAWDALRPDVRTSPGGMSQAEAEAWEQASAEHMEQMGAQVSEEIAAARKAEEPRQRIYQSVRDQLTNAGYTQDAAHINAELVAQRAATRADRLGKPLTGDELSSLTINNVLPPNLAPIVATDAGKVQLRSVINVMRRGAGSEAKAGPSLLQWIAKNGGIEDRGGDIASMGGGEWHRGKPGQRKLIRPHDDASQGSMLGGSGQQNANSPDELAVRAQEAGYFPAGERPTVNDLLEAIGGELRGSPVYAEADIQQADRTRAAADELTEMLDQAGLDPATATEAEIEGAIDAYRQEQAGDGYYQASDAPAATITGEEIGPVGMPTSELRAAARVWVKENLQQRDFHSDALNADVRIGQVRKPFSSSADPRKLRAFAALPDLIRNARLVETAPPKDIAREPTTKAYHYLEGTVIIGGEPHVVGLTVREDANGEFYYNHSIREEASPGPLDTASKAGPGTEGTTLRQDIIPSGDDINMTMDQPGGRQPRGQVTFRDGRVVIDLFQSRDMSTFVHEIAHPMLEELRADAAESNMLAADWDTVKSWFAANGHPIGEDGAIPVEAHELWARGFERFVMEGKSPSIALRRVFEAFRSWLLNIYKVVENLRSPITPEIREVMQRMVATDEEIRTASARDHLKALFDDATEAGMTAEEFAAYQDMASEARDEAFDALLYRTMSAIRRQRTEAWKAEERGVRDEITARIDRRPEFRAMHLLRTGRLLGEADAAPIRARLSREWLVAEYGEGILAQLPKAVPPIFAETDTMNADDIAEMVGFRTGDEMVRTLVTIEEQRLKLREANDSRSVRQALIDEETAVEMRDRHGDPLTDGSIEEEALAAVHNERQGELIASEMRSLSRRSNNQPTPYSVAKEWARAKIASSTVQEATSGAAIQRYARAAAKASREAEQALLARDIDEAYRAKQKQLLNNSLIAEAGRVRTELLAARDRLAGYAKRRTMRSMDQEYLERIHDLLEQVDLKDRSQRSIERQGSFEEWARAREAEGHDVIVPASFAATLGTKHWSRLSVEEMLGLDATVDQIAHLGRFKQRLLDAAEERDFDAVVDEAVAAAGELPQRPPSNLMEPGWRERFKSGVASIDASLLKMETVFDWLDGGNAQGVFNRVVFKPIADAQTRESDMLADYYGRIRAAMETVPKEALRRWQDRVEVPEMVNRETGMPYVLSRQQLVAAALNMGNAGNVQRLTDGYGWNRDSILRALNRELTEPEWRFVQQVWDIVDTLWPDISAMERRVNGVAPDKVEPVPIQTAFGEMRGGYYPAVYDTSRSLRAEKNAGRASDLLETTYTKANTRASATKDRSEQVNRPILLQLGVINRHLGEVIHDITHREVVMNADKFLGSERVGRALNESVGPEVRKQMRPWLKSVANQWANDRAGLEGLAGFVTKARANATAVGMGFRISTVIAQIGGYSNSFENVGPRWVLPAIAQAASHPVSTWRFITERSGEIRTRMDTLDRDLNAAIGELAGKRDLASDVKRFMYHGIGYTDRMVVVPTWIGAYNKALAAGAEETVAIYEADKAVRQSQGAGAPKDLAAVQRGTGSMGALMKIATMFYSYMSAFYQRQRTFGRDVSGAVRERDAAALPGLLARAWWLFAVPPVLNELLAGRGPDDDEDWGTWAFQQMLFQMLGPIPIARDLAKPAWDKAAGKGGFGYQISPMQRAGDTLVNTAGDVGRIARGEDTKRATRNALESVGYTTGLVPGQVATAAQFLVDVGHGEQSPEDMAEWYKGLTTGKAKPVEAR